jgi:hypothetical protein
MAQREFERCVANLPAAAQRGRSAGRLHAIGRSPLPAPGSGDGPLVPAGSPRRFAAALLHLQRWYGNRFVQQVVQGGASAPIIQAKVMAGPAGDHHEREADRVAGLVRSGRATRVPRAAGRASGVLRRAGADGDPVGAGVQQAIRDARGGGRSLPDGLRSVMEQALGADFASVRVHTDTRADQLNRVLQSRAFTTGQDLFFRRGEYNPSSTGGRGVLAHELTHVTQQMGAAVNADGSSGVPPGAGAGVVIQRMKIGGLDTNEPEGLSSLKARVLKLKTVGEVAAMRAEITSQLGDSQPDANVGYLLRLLDGVERVLAARQATGSAAPPSVLVPKSQPQNPTAAAPPAGLQLAGNTTAPPTATTEPPTPEPPAPENIPAIPEPPASTTTLEPSTTLAESDDSSAFVIAGPSVPVVVKVYAGKKDCSYNLREPADKEKFIEVITAAAPAFLKSYKRAFTAAVSDVLDPDREFADVIKAFVLKTKTFPPEPAPDPAKDQIKGYVSLSEWSQKDLPLFGSTLTKRMELASVPDLEASKKDHASRGYTLTLAYGPNAKSEQAAAVATHVANALHEVHVHGANLRQVVKVRDTNDLYFLNIRIPRAEETAKPPAQIDVTVDAVKTDNATAGRRIDLSKLNRSLSDRILQKDEVLYYQREAGGDRQKLDLKIKDWRSNEIALLRRAIDLIPPAHQSLLSELKFVRVPGVPGSMGGTAAQFFQTDPPVICVSDKAMDPDYGEYVHDAKTGEVLPKSVRLIVHEIGHAVSIERWRASALTYDKTKPESVDELNRLGGPKAIAAKPIADLEEYIKRGEYVTDYAASEMAGNYKETARSELFAEAYSLWLTDPDYMNRHHKVLAHWFATQKF